VEPVTSTPAELQKHIANEYEQVARIVKLAGIKAE
jgi:tripartite-type tricarboxylate transporter receptor subunit TctC